MLTVKGVGGISRDLPDRDLGPEFVEMAHNISASHGKYAAAYGFRTLDTLPETIYHMHPMTDARWRKLLLLGDTKAYGWDGNNAAFTDITDEALIPLQGDEKYSSDDIGGIAVFAQRDDYPRAWGDPSDAQDKVQYLPWDATDTWATKDVKTPLIRNYKNFLVTLGEVTASGGNPRFVRWSASVTDTNVLPYWEPLPENDAGFVELADLDTEIVDGRPLGDAFIIYSRNSAYLMQWVGGQSVMRFQRLNSLPGVMKKNLVMPFENSHFVVGQTDIYAHSGAAPQSLVDRKIREVIYARLNSDNLKHVFLIKNWQMQEIWICVGDADGVDTAFAWNWKSNNWTTRGIPHSYFGVSGVSPVEHMTWDTIPYETWDTIPGTWAGLGPKEATMPEMLFSATSESLIQRDTGIINDCQCEASIERHGIPIGDYRQHYTLNTVYPNIAKSPVTIQAGMQYFENGAITWSAPQVYDPTTTKKIDVRGDSISGSLLCYRIYNETPSLFEFTGLEAELVECGRD